MFVLGVWPEGSDGTDINALIRSHNRKVIALADDFCKVHLFSYPCSTAKVSDQVGHALFERNCFQERFYSGFHHLCVHRLPAINTVLTAVMWPMSASCIMTVTWSPLAGKTPASCSGVWWKNHLSVSMAPSSLTLPTARWSTPLA